MSSFPLSARIGIGAAVFALGAGALFFAGQPNRDIQQAVTESNCATRAYAEIGGPFSLIDQTGAPMTEADLKGGHSLVFFGFAYCPDICPMTLVKLRDVLEQLPEGVEKPTPVMITIDPERDTPEELALYASTPAFPQNLVALTGDSEAIKSVADAFKAAYWRIDQPNSVGGYTMGHTDIVYLMDDEWRLSTFFTYDETPEDMAACIADAVA